MRNATITIMTISFLFITLISGCNTDKVQLYDEKVELKVLLDWNFPTDKKFITKYVEPYRELFPNVSFKFIEGNPTVPFTEHFLSYEGWLERYENDVPDIIMPADRIHFQWMLSEGYLESLDYWIVSDQFDIHNINPGYLEYIRIIGKGSLYGVGSVFNGAGLYYNKHLFDENDVEYPTDGMSLGQILDLIEQFKHNSAYGFYIKELPLPLLMEFGQEEGLFVRDKTSETITIYTDETVQLFEKLIHAMDTRAIAPIDEVEDLFIQGSAAMTRRMYAGNFINLPVLDQLEWDVVSYPYSYWPLYGNIFSINSASRNKLEAWNFVKYVTGSEYIPLLDGRELPSRLSVFKEMVNNQLSGKNLEAFYNENVNKTNVVLFDYIDDPRLTDFIYYSIMYHPLVNRPLERAIRGEITAREALTEAEDELQAILERH